MSLPSLSLEEFIQIYRHTLTKILEEGYGQRGCTDTVHHEKVHSPHQIRNHSILKDTQQEIVKERTPKSHWARIVGKKFYKERLQVLVAGQHHAGLRVSILCFIASPQTVVHQYYVVHDALQSCVLELYYILQVQRLEIVEQPNHLEYKVYAFAGNGRRYAWRQA